MRTAALCATACAFMLVTGAAATAQTVDVGPLETRVTISYQNAPAVEVLGALAKAGGFAQVRIPQEPLWPVTITLTNTKLRTALDAVCQNAACSWKLFEPYFSRAGEQTNVLLITAVAQEFARALPGTVSLTLRDTPVSQVFVVLAEAVHVRLMVPVSLPGKRINFEIKDAETTGVLKLLCDIANCSWTFDSSNSTLRVVAKP